MGKPKLLMLMHSRKVILSQPLLPLKHFSRLFLGFPTTNNTTFASPVASRSGATRELSEDKDGVAEDNYEGERGCKGRKERRKFRRTNGAKASYCTPKHALASLVTT
jgi:hypothetical protein